MAEYCIFCEWGEAQEGNIWENELFISRYDTFPVSPGHALVIPRRHVISISDLNHEEWTLLERSIKDVIKVVENTNLKALYRGYIDNSTSDISKWFCRRALEHPRIGTKPDAYNHGINDGRAAGRTVDHLHWHIIPRFEGDMKDPRGGVRYVIPEMGNYKVHRFVGGTEDLFHLGIKALVRNRDGDILLLKVNRNKLKGYKGEPYWDIPGGRIHKNSTVEDTLKREIEEETGITSVTNFNKFDMVLSNNVRVPQEDGADVGLILAVYVCDIPEVSSIKISEEHTEYGWFSQKQASELLKIKYPIEFTTKIAKLP